MHDTIQHFSAIELEQGLTNVLESPTDAGSLMAIFVRPARNERRALETAMLTPEGGIDGDRWATDSYYQKDRQGEQRSQITIMNGRFLRQIAGADARMRLAGDNLIVDLNLSESNLPAGSQLAIGSEVIIEINDHLHSGCSKFAERFGKEARIFANNERGAALHLRGRHGSVVRGGAIRVGDTIRKHVRE